MTFWMVVYAIGAAQAALLALALWRRPANAQANQVLAAWLALVAVDLAVKAMFLSAPSAAWFRAFLCAAQFPFVYGCFFYVYVRTLTTARALSWRDALHLLGLLLALGLIAPALFADDARVTGMMQLWLERDLPPPVPWYAAFLYAWSLAYVVAALVRVARYRREVRERRADADRMSLRWVVAMALGQMLIWGVAVLTEIARIPGVDYYLIYGAVVAWTCVLGYASLSQVPVSPETPATEAPAAPEPVADDPRLPQVLARLSKLMDEDALYLEPALTIAQVARRSGYPEYLVSATINRRCGCSFWDYINQQRIEAARRRLADPDDARTILDIAYACGFTSKSTFNTAFKRETGTTPSAYRAQHASAQSSRLG